VKPKNQSEAEQSVVGRLPDKIEPSDLPLLNEALAYLFEQLGKATELYQAEPNAGREGVIHSVETVLKFLSVFAPVISLSLHAPLAVLFDALMTLDEGKVLPLLRPVKKSGRARASAMRESLMGVVVFHVDRLTETGMPAEAARKAVSRTLKNLGISPARGRASITARTIRGWCERVRADVGRHGEAAQAYDGLIAADPKDRATDGLPPTELRTALLGRLAEMAKKIRAHEGA
jgi:hypothetical protein